MTSKVERSLPLTLAMLGFSILMGSISSSLYEYAGFGRGSGFFGWIGFLATALLAVLGVLGAVFTAGRARCPHCNETLSILDLRADIECASCPSCKNFYEIKQPQLLPIEDSRVAERPIFPVPVPEGKFDWPKVCAVCEKKSTRAVEVTTALPPSGEPLPFGLRVAAVLGFDKSRLEEPPLRFSVPHCKDHSDGVELEGGSDPRFKFRSLPYRQRFLSLPEKK
jgi:phage FluMu protein Com